MRQLLIALCCFLAPSYAYADLNCPEDLLSLGRDVRVLAALKALNPLTIEKDPSSDKCVPKTSVSIALGTPLCLFDGIIPVIASGVIALEEGNVISYLYLADYSPENHKRLFDSLNSHYKEIPYSNYPERLKSMPVHQELTGLFKTNDTYILLQKPSKGMPGRWQSEIIFTKEGLLNIFLRDLNSCK